MKNFIFPALRKSIALAGLAKRECRYGFTLTVIAQTLLLASPADALVVTVNSIDYDITFQVGTYASLYSNGSGTLTQQPWWNKYDLATQFATAYSTAMNSNYSSYMINELRSNGIDPIQATYQGTAGGSAPPMINVASAFFNFGTDNSIPQSSLAGGIYVRNNGLTSNLDLGITANQANQIAYAVVNPQGVPGPLPFLGLPAAGIAISRLRHFRRRIHALAEPDQS